MKYYFLILSSLLFIYCAAPEKDAKEDTKASKAAEATEEGEEAAEPEEPKKAEKETSTGSILVCANPCLEESGYVTEEEKKNAPGNEQIVKYECITDDDDKEKSKPKSEEKSTA